MVGSFEKKSEQIAVKLEPQTLKDIEEICRLEDRPVGYIVRGLMLRGLALYQKDGQLREVLGGMGTTNGDNRIARVKNIGTLTDERVAKKKKTG